MPKQNKSITIPFTEGDLDDLRNGEQFEWTFETEDGESIDVVLRLETDEDFEG